MTAATLSEHSQVVLQALQDYRDKRKALGDDYQSMYEALEEERMELDHKDRAMRDAHRALLQDLKAEYKETTGVDIERNSQYECDYP